MFRTLALSTLALLALDGVSTVLAPVTGVSLTSEAAAADFTGRIRRIRIQERHAWSSYKVTTNAEDDGDATTADAVSLELTVCSGDVCSDPVALSSDGYTGVFRSSRFAYDGAEVPEGEFKLTTALVNGDGKHFGATQTWHAMAKGGEITVNAEGDADAKPYLSELSLSSDDCGNGKVKAEIAGDDADSVASFEVVDVEGTLFSMEDVESCDTGACVTGTLKKGKARYTESGADLGKLGEILAASAEAKVTVSVTAYNADGKALGTAKTEAVAKYGDILIDGVPLEFD